MAKTISLPNNLEAERSVLGAMLIDEDAASIALASLTEESFSGADMKNKLVFRAMKELGDRKMAIDPQTVNDELINMKLNEDAGCPDYLLDLVNSSINPNNVDHYISIVRDQAVLRDYLLQMETIKKSYAEGEVTDIGDFITSSTQALDNIASKRTVGDFKTSEVIATLVSHQIDQERSRTNKHLTGVDTGYERLNKFTHGWQKGDLIVIGARPGMGKTAFGINLAYNAVIHDKKPVAFFSCEMDASLIMKRLCSAVSLVNSENIQTGELTPNDVLKVNSALGQIGQTPIYFDDSPNPMLGDVLAKSRKLKAAHPDLCLIIIDYLNIIGIEARVDSRAQAIGVITKSLKELARSLHVPVIVLAQLNRNVEDNENCKPMLSNLKESGSIEQDADMILLMYRADYYKGMGKKQGKQPYGKHNDYTNEMQNQVDAAKAAGNDNGNVSVTCISLAKNRNGRTGEITLIFSKNYSRFDNPSPELESEQARLNGMPVSPDDE
jgi:replicative DNA helicase